MDIVDLFPCSPMPGGIRDEGTPSAFKARDIIKVWLPENGDDFFRGNLILKACCSKPLLVKLVLTYQAPAE